MARIEISVVANLLLIKLLPESDVYSFDNNHIADFYFDIRSDTRFVDNVIHSTTKTC